MPRADVQPCQWLSERDAFRAFATHEGKTQSAGHIKPLHWYVASRLVVEGGFHPDNVTPRPPFAVKVVRSKGKDRHQLVYDPRLGGTGEQVILGGLKTKNVDVVVNLPQLGPIMAVSCKGVTKSFRNLTNRMEETIGECTNLHITYPAMVIGYFALLRANRTPQDAVEAPDIDAEDTIIQPDDDGAAADTAAVEAVDPSAGTASIGNDLAVDHRGTVVNGIVRFHAALREMTGRRGIRDEISRYEAMAMALVEPKGDVAGTALASFPGTDSPLHLEGFFQTLYQRYEERFVYGAPLLADRGISTRFIWADDSPAFSGGGPSLSYEPRIS